MRRCDSCGSGVRRRKARIVTEGAVQLAVLGSPIAHSKSPALHGAAYRALGLDWEYSAIEVRSGELERFLAAGASRWRGLSLTMPLKREILPLLDKRDDVALAAGVVNTVLFADGRLRGFNTDVDGAKRMLGEALSGPLRAAHILGAGATACSLAVALSQLGVRELTVSTRTPARAQEISEVAIRHGMTLAVVGMDEFPGSPDVVVSTLPGNAEFPLNVPRGLRSTVPLVDIAYDPWPTAVASHWLEAGGDVVNNGLGMLVYQALAQVRIFVHGDPTVGLKSEPVVLAAMRAAAFGRQ